MFEFVFDVNPVQHECLAEAIYHEARGESYTGQLFVGFVIKNRMKSDKFPDTYCGVINDPWQFSYIHELKDKTPYEKDAMTFAKQVAELIMVTPNPLPNTVFYYHAISMTPETWDWSKLEEYQLVNNHIFYNEVS